MQEVGIASLYEKSSLGVVHPPVFSVETSFGVPYARGNHAVQGKSRGRVNSRKQQRYLSALKPQRQLQRLLERAALSPQR